MKQWLRYNIYVSSISENLKDREEKAKKYIIDLQTDIGNNRAVVVGHKKMRKRIRYDT